MKQWVRQVSGTPGLGVVFARSTLALFTSSLFQARSRGTGRDWWRMVTGAWRRLKRWGSSLVSPQGILALVVSRGGFRFVSVSDIMPDFVAAFLPPVARRGTWYSRSGARGVPLWSSSRNCLAATVQWLTWRRRRGPEQSVTQFLWRIDMLLSAKKGDQLTFTGTA